MHPATLSLPVAMLSLHCAANSPTDLASLLRNRQLTMSVKGAGGHSGECVNVSVNNLRSDSLVVRIPAGWRFVSQDSTLQDLLVVEDEVLALAPKAAGTLTCRAFCCEASMGGPDDGSAFTAGTMASEPLQKLARFFTTEHFPDGAVQQAVWAVSDGNDLSGIASDTDESTRRLREFVSTLTGRPNPWYTTTYAPPVDGRVFNPTPQHITGHAEFTQRHAGILSIVVKDARGSTVYVLDEGRDLRQGFYKVQVEVTVQGWEKGRYAICFATDGVLLKKQEFEL
ncbi:MAG: hypothetical protein IPN85_12025 [Flavobacteriales bacterium]|nr:hypothetical protein [Flavobacteriales bacterium]MBK9288348.1 hypothetical protein [Flavobacteriales bacterium]